MSGSGVGVLIVGYVIMVALIVSWLRGDLG